MKLKKTLGIVLSTAMIFSCSQAFVLASEREPSDLGSKPESVGTKVLPGESDWGIIGQDSKKCKVNVTVDDNGVIKKVEVKQFDYDFSYRSYINPLKNHGVKYYEGKTLKYVLKMDTLNACGAHVLGNKDIVEGKSNDTGAPATVLKEAVLNALGYKSKAVSDPKTDIVVKGEARNGYKYDEKVKVIVNKDGVVIKVEDDGTEEQTNYVTKDNLKRIKLFKTGRGYHKFVGKTAAEIQAMELGKFGVDSISGATFSSYAEQKAVLNALSKSNTPKGNVPVENLRVFEGISKMTSEKVSSSHVKVKIHLDDAGRIARIEDNGSYPDLPPTVSTKHTWNAWENFARYRGFHKFIGMTKEQVENADTAKMDSIFVAYKQTDLSTMAKEAILDAFSKDVNSHEPEDPQQQEEEKELQEYKLKLNDELQSLYSLADYREEQKKQVSDIVSTSKERILAAKDRVEAKRIFDEAKEEIEKIKTDAQLKEEEAKVQAEKELKEYQAKLVQDLEAYKNIKDYRIEEQKQIAEIKKNAAEKINAAKDKEKAHQVFDTAKTELDKVKTDEQLTEAEKAQQEADELSKLKAKLGVELVEAYPYKNYRAEERKALPGIIYQALTNIYTAKDKVKAQKAFEEAKATLDSIKTDAQLTAEEEKAKAEKEARRERKLQFVDTTEQNRGNDVKYDFKQNKVEVISGKAKKLVLKLDVDFAEFLNGGKVQLGTQGKFKDLGNEDFTAVKGSVVVTVSGNYLNSIAPGDYVLRVRTAAGYGDIDMSVAKSELKSEKPSNDSKSSIEKPNSKQYVKIGMEAKSKKSAKIEEDKSSPNTGDTNNIELLMVIFGVTLIAVAIILRCRKPAK